MAWWLIEPRGVGNYPEEWVGHLIEPYALVSVAQDIVAATAMIRLQIANSFAARPVIFVEGSPKAPSSAWRLCGKAIGNVAALLTPSVGDVETKLTRRALQQSPADVADVLALGSRAPALSCRSCPNSPETTEAETEARTTPRKPVVLSTGVNRFNAVSVLGFHA
jgi:hypothetical protein